MSMNNRPHQIGNYVFDREIGRGATSEVWLAHHAFLDHRQVAVKLLLNQNVETVQRFNREAELLSQLHHANIVQVYDHGRYEYYYYSVLEYINGYSLQQMLERENRLDFHVAFNIFRQVAEALDHAHSLDIIHRDVSPGNVLIEKETSRAALADFGIARDINQKITVDDKVMGTPGYWSPEHARSATEVTQLSDIYGLGVLLYVMLSGVLPWDDSPVSPDQPFGSFVTLKRQGVNNVPPDVDRIIQTMLAIDPNKRFPSALAAVEELERLSKRHQAVTQTHDKKKPDGEEKTPETVYYTANFQALGVERNDVEITLGPDLIRKPVAEAHKRAEELCQPQTITQLLNTWSRRGFYHGLFRRTMLGRLARLHRVSSHNIYHYRLQVLYEERGEPRIIEEPDHDKKNYPLEPEVDRWQVSLPSVQGFEAHSGGQVDVPGSFQVVSCRSCNGKGKIICPRCKGNRRVIVTQQVEVEVPPEQRASPQGQGSTGSTSQRSGGNSSSVPSYKSLVQGAGGNPSQAMSVATQTTTQTQRVLVPCPDCDGVGGSRCAHCEGTGRMVQRKAFHWQRIPRVFEHNDEDQIPKINEKWLQEHLQTTEIYHEQVFGNIHSKEPAFRPEWKEIPEVAALLQSANDKTNPGCYIIMSELTIGMIPVTDVMFDLSKDDENVGKNDYYQITIYGFQNLIPPDWRLFNWERVIWFWVNLFLVVLVVIFGFFAWGF